MINAVGRNRGNGFITHAEKPVGRVVHVGEPVIHFQPYDFRQRLQAFVMITDFQGIKPYCFVVMQNIFGRNYVFKYICSHVA